MTLDKFRSSSRSRRDNPTARGRGRGGGHADAPSNGNRNVSVSRSHSKAADAKLKLELVPSISRSGGDGGLGDTLKDTAIQEQYWNGILEKFAAHRREFTSNSNKSQKQKEKEGNILLLLRKLREGVFASQRMDKFALEVYETSFFLAVIFDSPAQASSSLSHIPDLYVSLQRKLSTTELKDSTSCRGESLTIVALVFRLSEAFPSQRPYYCQEKSLEISCPSQDTFGAVLHWVSSVRASLSCRNYTKFEVLTRESRLRGVIGDIPCLSGSELSSERRYLVETALYSIVNALRSKIRGVALSILRSAYREFNLSSNSETTAWLSRSLLLEPVGECWSGVNLDEWMRQNVANGVVVEKEGFQGRWILKR